MSGTSTQPSGDNSGIARKVGIVALYGGAYVGAKLLLKSLCPAIPDDQIAAAAAGSGALLKTFGDAIDSLLGNIAASRIDHAVFQLDGSPVGKSGLNHDIERALARAAARTLLQLRADWEKIPATSREWDITEWDETTALDACRAFLDQPADAPIPTCLDGWLTELSGAKFTELPEQNAAGWRHSGPIVQNPEGGKFSHWLLFRWADVFHINFADELGSDTAAYRKLTLRFFDRLFTKCDVIQTQLDEIRTLLQQPQREWAAEAAKLVLDDIRKEFPDLARLISQNLQPEFLALTGFIADGFSIAEINNQRRHEILYASLSELKSQVAILTSDHHARSGAAPLPWDLQLDRYALFVLNAFARVELLQALGRSEADAAVSLGQIFVEPELATLLDPRTKDHDGPLDQRHAAHADDPAERQRLLGKETLETFGGIHSRRLAFLALNDPARSLHIILGDPGSGKSTLLRLLAVRWAEAHLIHRATGAPGTVAIPIPILTEVRSWLAARDKDHTLTLHTYHCSTIHPEYHFHQPDLEAAMHNGQAILLVDGLDEAFVAATRTELRAHIRALAVQFSTLRLLVTSRGFRFEVAPWRNPKEAAGLRDWTFHTVEPFSPADIRRFLAQWHQLGHHEPALRERRRAALAAAIEKHDHVRRLAMNPMLLTLVCLVVRSGPADISRKELYTDAEAQILFRWDEKRGLPLAEGGRTAHLPELTFQEKRSFFCRVAATMMDLAEQTAQDARRKAAYAYKKFDPASLPDSNQITEAALIALIRDIAPDYPDHHDALAILRERNYLLCFRGEGTFSFIHRSFLEYFTALNWAIGFDNEQYDGFDDFYKTIITPRWQDETWNETLRFLIALLRNPVAAKCLDRLAAEPPVFLDKDKKHPVPTGLILAAELVQELSPYTHTANARPGQPRPPTTPAEVAAKWKDALFQFIETPWNAVVTSREDATRHRELKKRGMLAIAALWRGDTATGHRLTALIHRTEHYNVNTWALGEALGAGWREDTEISTYLRDLALSAIPSPTSPLSHPSLKTVNAELRLRAVGALGEGWSGDAATGAWLRALVDSRRPDGTPAEPDTNVRMFAKLLLKKGWSGDAATGTVR